jgi:hypothetical protein
VAQRRERWCVFGHRVGGRVDVFVGHEAAATEQALDAACDRRHEPRHLAIGGRWCRIEACGAGRVGREDAVLC